MFFFLLLFSIVIVVYLFSVKAKHHHKAIIVKAQNVEIANLDLWTFKMKELNLDIQNLKLSSKKNIIKIIQIFFVFLCTVNKNFKHLHFNLTSDKFGSF